MDRGKESMERAVSDSSNSWHPAHRPNGLQMHEPTSSPKVRTSSLGSTSNRDLREVPEEILEVAKTPYSKSSEDIPEAWSNLPTQAAKDGGLSGEESGAAEPASNTLAAPHESRDGEAKMPSMIDSDLGSTSEFEGMQADPAKKEMSAATTEKPLFNGIVTLDRSNSFPHVPAGRSLQLPSQSLPHSQAGKIIEDEDFDDSLVVDEEVSFPQYAQEQGTPNRSQDPKTDVVSQDHHNISENSIPPSSEQSRFEEGLPLLSTQADVPESSPKEDIAFNKQTNEQKQESKAGNDFFEQSSDHPYEKGVYPSPRKLDRKTTGDVIGAMNFASTGINDAEPDFGDFLKSDTIAAEKISEETRESEHTSAKAEGLDAVWQAALEDDDLLDENTSIDPSSFFGDDTTDFLPEGSNEESAGKVADERSTATGRPNSLPNQYAPSSSMPLQTDQSNARYQPKTPTSMPQRNVSNGLPPSLMGQGNNSIAPPVQLEQINGLVPPRPQMPQSAQSFADKSKGGYTSPYDLPMDVARPAKKRNFTHNSRHTAGSTNTTGPRGPPPPRSSSMYANASATLQSPPPLPTSQGPRSVQAQSRPDTKPQSSGFFEELPSAKPRPASRRGIPSHQQAPSTEVFAPPAAYRPASSSSDEVQSFGLMPPSRVGPYATAANHTPAAPASTPMSSRYPPGMVPQHGVPPPRTRYAASPSNVSKGPPPPIIPFQPRTSSPLAQKAPAYQEDRDASNQQSPPRRQMSIPVTNISSPPRNTAQDNRYDSLSEQRPLINQQPPEPHDQMNFTLNHLDRSFSEAPLHRNYDEVRTQDIEPMSKFSQADIRSPLLDNHFVPPPRSMTQSPGAVRPRGSLAALNQDSLQRPASVNARPSNTQRATYSPGANPNVPLSAHQRPFAQTVSDNVHFVKPDNDMQYDPLERWKGSPIIRFGFGGTVVSSVPLRIPRYSAGLMTPSIMCTTGDIKIQNLKDILSVESVGLFPGPLKSKGKKKDLLEWLQRKIAQVQNQFGNEPSDPSVPDCRKRFEEKVLLWQLVQVFVEHDGVIEGKPAAENAARLKLSPDLSQDGVSIGSTFLSSPPGISRTSGVPPLSEPADPGAMEALRRLLLQGEREKAVYYALDRRLWAHAMLISSTMEKSVWKQVLQEFVRQEVKITGENTESLAALYQIFAGNWEESVDELVPPSARAGMQLVSKVTGPGPIKNALDGLDRWRETVTLALGNPVPGNGQAMAALGRLLASYGRVEASHICYLFAKNPLLFGAPDDPNVAISLLGIDHKEQPQDYYRDIDSILLTEVFDFANNILRSGQTVSSLHMQPHKLYHAYFLADNGYKAEAQAYCDDLAGYIKSSPKAQAPYLSQLMGPLEDLSSRLRQAQSSSSGSWMPKPTMDKVSGSLMSRFTSFVAGEDSDADSNGSGKGQAPDPFAKVAGDTPGVSPSPSSGDLYGAYASGGTYAPSQPPLTVAGSRYAPPGVVTPRSSLDQGGRPSQESPRALPNDARKTSMYQQSSTSRYAAPAFFSEVVDEPKEGSYQPSPYQPQPNTSTSYLPTPPLQPDQTSPSGPSPHTSLLNQQATSPFAPQTAPQPLHISQGNPSESPETNTSNDEPSFGSYEPPSSGYTPYSPPALNSPPTSPRKKMSFTDLSDDEDSSARNVPTTKGNDAAAKAQRDRDADAAFRAAAEADAKKDQTVQPKKSGWLGGWFGSKKGDDLSNSNSGGGGGQSGTPGAPIRAKLGEENSFYYDKELKKWVNKKAGADAARAAAPTPPPPKGGPPLGSRAVSAAGGPPPRSSTDAPPLPPLPAGTPPVNITSAPLSAGPPAAPFSTPSNPASRSESPAIASGSESTAPLSAASNLMPGGTGPPPSRPGTAVSNASSIDDLLGGPAGGPRAGGTMKKKKRGYVDVMAK